MFFEVSYLFFLYIYIFPVFVVYNADIGADVLDLAETMIASDGLKYEPVSFYLTIFFTVSTRLYSGYFLFFSTFQVKFELPPEQKLWQM